jgi:hypothetical protein
MDGWVIFCIVVGAVLLILPLGLIWYLHVVSNAQDSEERHRHSQRVNIPYLSKDESAVASGNGGVDYHRV